MGGEGVGGVGGGLLGKWLDGMGGEGVGGVGGGLLGKWLDGMGGVGGEGVGGVGGGVCREGEARRPTPSTATIYVPSVLGSESGLCSQEGLCLFG
ncbi:hypothetical protein Pmani_005739 [Petrolisthes manimaculis]|uniref:Uncharacterized protein n=1 Tax=Petrolisthes manimaculis TaxID=1843537 RepID=A0AAE1QBL9_9EUCA|nr:hypothetical protein Pmani_005739 [Petrolisthes manimaculis]